jgi:hypothetical protein
MAATGVDPRSDDEDLVVVGESFEIALGDPPGGGGGVETVGGEDTLGPPLLTGSSEVAQGGGVATCLG